VRFGAGCDSVRQLAEACPSEFVREKRRDLGDPYATVSGEAVIDTLVRKRD